MENHNCLNQLRFCRHCLTDHNPKDICRMRFKKMDPTRGKLCFLALSICNSNDNADCYECVNKKKICNIHEQFSDNGNGHCNLVYVVHENIKNGSYGQSYSLEVFTEDSVLQIPEFETKFSSQLIVDSNERKGRYNKLPKNRGIDAIRNVEPRDSLEVFIKEAILTMSYCNGLLVGQGILTSMSY